MPSITNLIGIMLVIVAIVSAGGLYYVASEYSKISETLVSVEATISEVNICIDNQTGECVVTASILMNNPSKLDIDIYRIEYLTYADKETSSLTEYDREIGGIQSSRNGTILKDSLTELQYTYTIYPDTTYMNRLDYAMDGGSTVWVYIGGLMWFRISDYPDVSEDIGVGYFTEVVVTYV